VDQDGQVIDVLVSTRRDAAAARRFLRRALTTLKVTPSEVVTDAAPVYPAVLDELVPSAWHHVERHANNRIEADHGQLKHRLRPMRGLRTDRTAQTIIAGHAFMQNLRRGHYEFGLEAPSGSESPQRSPSSPPPSEPAEGTGLTASPDQITQRRRAGTHCVRFGGRSRRGGGDAQQPRRGSPSRSATPAPPSGSTPLP
jgi:hypothetical protein